VLNSESFIPGIYIFTPSNSQSQESSVPVINVIGISGVRLHVILRVICFIRSCSRSKVEDLGSCSGQWVIPAFLCSYTKYEEIAGDWLSSVLKKENGPRILKDRNRLRFSVLYIPRFGGGFWGTLHTVFVSPIRN
jgi:hypothetical protein